MTFVLLAHFENDFNSLNQPGTRSQKNQSGFLTWLAEAPALGSSSDAFFRYNNNEWVGQEAEQLGLEVPDGDCWYYRWYINLLCQNGTTLTTPQLNVLFKIKMKTCFAVWVIFLS